MVGNQGAAEFYRSRGDITQSERLCDCGGRTARSKEFSAGSRHSERLTRFYRRSRSETAQQAAYRTAQVIFQEISQSYRQAFPQGRRYKRLAEGPINNALMLSFAVYHESSGLQEADGALRRKPNALRFAVSRNQRTRRWSGLAPPVAELQRRTVPLMRRSCDGESQQTAATRQSNRVTADEYQPAALLRAVVTTHLRSAPPATAASASTIPAP